MKTSNKLLIAFASALILIQVVGMAIVCSVFYEKNDLSKVWAVEMDTFGVIPKDMSAIAISAPFTSVNIDGNNQMHLLIKLVEDEKPGIKFSNNAKGLISAVVDGVGQLQIILKASGKQEGRFTRISVYGPHIKQLRVVNAQGMNLNAEMDTLQLNLIKTVNAHFDTDTKIGQLNIQTDAVQKISFRETNTKSVNLSVNNTEVRADMSSFDNLSIHALGTSHIEINGGYGRKPEKVIKQLTLNTLGYSKVKIFNTQVKQCSGRFSDSTLVEMPAVNINQMYNAKK